MTVPEPVPAALEPFWRATSIAQYVGEYWRRYPNGSRAEAFAFAHRSRLLEAEHRRIAADPEPTK